MEVFCKQIELASAFNKNRNIIILGDANLNSNKWDDPGFLHVKVATVLRYILDQNGLTVFNLRDTYLANHAQKMIM